jgi:hypothetical protein
VNTTHLLLCKSIPSASCHNGLITDLPMHLVTLMAKFSLAYLTYAGVSRILCWAPFMSMLLHHHITWVFYVLGLGWEVPPPNFRIFFIRGEFLPPIVTNPDIISYAHLLPSEGIEIMSGFTNCTSKGPFIIYDWGWAGKKRGWVMRYF